MDRTDAPADPLARGDGADRADREQTYVTLADETDSDGESDADAAAEDSETATDDAAGGPAGDPEDEDETQREKSAEDGRRRRPGSAKWRDRARAAERELAELRARRNREEPHAVQDGDDLKEPQEQDFKDWLSYQDARTEWRMKKALREEEQRKSDAAARARSEREQADRVAVYHDNLKSVRDRIPDYDRVMAEQNGVFIADNVAAQILESPKGPLLAYYLAKNLDKVAELNRMPPMQAAREIGRLEARIRIPKGNSATKVRPVRETPRGGAAPPNRDPSSMSMADFVKWREGR
jgi:hypothetical protein